ncbi:type IX secretion system sortase PorU [Flavobacterium piscinae]|uniref:Type IX secretion system sortase PorU n=1 Tax=Flavobacterium piscinae TaxID=2506424 RepID=A0A4Q1KX29_9FLAO|nr:type IX secretion system sortase PorU [Flavobacterium piscinae]RXR34891.1 type IX secretion system sortase PorU [Flavobacterium piscinae]
MKKIILVYLLFNFVVSFAQNTININIDWQSNTLYNIGNHSLNLPHFQLKNFYFDDSKRMIFFTQKFNISLPIDENSIQISSVSYENISPNELGDLNVKEIPSAITLNAKNEKTREALQFFLTFSPVIKSIDGYKKVKSLTITYKNADNSLQNFGNRFDFNSIQSSVLSTGDWYRFYIEKSGVYKISRSFLSQLGMNVNVDPRNIKIYGNGGRMIPLLNSIEYPSDLEENAILFVGEEDGVFNPDDFILFYAEGFGNWNAESSTHLNLYAEKSYYYITAQGGSGKRIENAIQPSESASIVFSTYDDYQFYEKDVNNIGRIGRIWYGDQFSSQTPQTIDFSFPTILANSTIQLTVNSAAVSLSSSSLTIAAGGQQQSINFSAIPTFSSTLYSNGTTTLSVPSTQNLSVQLTYNNNGVPSAKGYLNYIIARATSNLQGYGKQFRFQNNSSSTLIGIGEFQLTNASGIQQVWDITDIYNVSKYENSGSSIFNFKADLGEIRKYIAIDANDYFTPLRESQSKVVNQDIKGTIFNNAQGQFQDIDYLIISPLNLASEAERLANFHRNYSNLNVKVVTLDKIYQEFSSGKQDIGAIRNLVKYVYNNASDDSKRIKYLNLFGDASFDYKDRIPNNTNIVPIFHSLNSESLLSSTMSDDFYGMMDDNEGLMGFGANGLDIAVGRMLVSSLQQAKEMVDKVIQYHDINSYGRWRNNFTLVSDDVDESWENQIQNGIDNLGNTINDEKPFVNVLKFHADSYVQEASAGGQRYPKLKQELLNAIQNGSLVFNYFGHGGEDQLSSERIFEKTDAQNLNNQYRYPLIVTVTCEFTRFDNPFRPTAGEYTYWNPTGGAISLITTTRQIGVTTGQNINEEFSSFLYGYDQNSNEEISIAEALRRAKNNYNSPTLMVFYIGDPALKLAIPKPKIVLTTINDEPVASSTVVFNALSKIKLTGEIRDNNGDVLLSNYNGDIAVQIFDKSINRTTLGNDNTRDGANNLILMNFQTLGETIFRGNASVSNGLFEIEFIVPKDISIPVGNGRISFYAKSTNPVLQDQTGFDTSILIGGINENAPEDNIGPRVRLYMNDESFISGGITNASPIFLAFLEDENGINTASGIGHDIVAILDGDENNPYILNDYYETELNDYTNGKVRFPFRDLAPGLHTITFRAWDVYNNPVSAEIQFIVVGDETISLTNVLNYPNPFVSYTQFWFSHNRPFEPLDVQVQIFTITGKIVKTINQVVNTEGFLSREITWDGRDDFGDKIGKGVYVYKLTVKSNLTNKKVEKIEKLVIL